MPERLATGQLERRVMQTLWRAETPLFPASATTQFPRSEISLTAVMTLLLRLWRKGQLHRERQGRTFAYQTGGEEGGVCRDTDARRASCRWRPGRTRSLRRAARPPRRPSPEAPARAAAMNLVAIAAALVLFVLPVVLVRDGARCGLATSPSCLLSAWVVELP